MDADSLKGWDNLPTTFSDNPENVADNSFVPDKDAETLPHLKRGAIRDFKNIRAVKYVSDNLDYKQYEQCID